MRAFLVVSWLLLGCGGGGGGGRVASIEVLTTQPVLVAPGARLSIEVADVGVDPDARTDVYADADGDPATGNDQIPIAMSLPSGDGAARSLFWDTTGVPSGTYSIVAVLHETEADLSDVARDLVTLNIPPEVAVDDPPEATLAGATITVRYRDADADDLATTDLVLDGDGDPNTTADQYVIAADRPEQAHVIQEVVWDTTGVPEGEYTLLALTSDGVYPPRVAAAALPVRLGSTWITVKDASGRGAAAWPVSTVVPLEEGGFFDVARFRLEDAGGAPVPAQFEVLNRWWHADGSLRHVVVHFVASVPADGTARYRVRVHPDGAAAPARPVGVAQAAGTITVDTGAVRFRVATGAFNLFDEVHVDADGDGTYAADEQVVAPGASDGPVFTGRLAGDIQRARERGDLQFEVEEAGPVRAVLRVSAPTVFNATDDHTHGFAVRIHAWAGLPFVKVDYQLQNSATNVRFSWPLYFEDMSLHVRTALDAPTVRFGPRAGVVWSGAPGRYLFQSSLTDVSAHAATDDSVLAAETVPAGESSFGWADVADGRLGMAVMIRHMAGMWPNGVEVAADQDVAVRLWPEWSAQFHEKQLSPTGLYWLEDMQHVVKEVLFHFHGAGATDAALETMAHNFQYHPVAFVDLADFRRTRVTVDLLGVFPRAEGLDASGDTKRVSFAPRHVDPTDAQYNFGWMNFGGHIARKAGNNAGGWPTTAAHVLASPRIDSYFEAERAMWGDLNVRGLWLSGYEHDTHFDLIGPTENPYGSKSWRAFDGRRGTSSHISEPYLDGTSFGGWKPRGNAHAWFYHVEEFYLASGNPWIRDWYRFVGEFRKRTLFQTGAPDDPLREWGWSTRGEGHMLANALQAYRVTGDAQLLDGLRRRLDYLREIEIDPQYGVIDPTGEAPFQNGYLARALLALCRELRGSDPEYAAKAFFLAWGLVEWNHNIGRWGYYIDSTIDNGPVESDSTALTMVGPAAAFYLLTGRRDVLEDLSGYVDTGYNGGNRPFGDFPVWEGGWEGRAHEYVRLHPKSDETPPAAVTNLVARESGGSVRLEWTAPADAMHYVVVWSELPIARTFTKAADERNFWAGHPVAQTLHARPGATETLLVPGLPAGQTLHFAIVAADASGNLSAVSNVASVVR